jgi:hypothetical protein
MIMNRKAALLLAALIAAFAAAIMSYRAFAPDAEALTPAEYPRHGAANHHPR